MDTMEVFNTGLQVTLYGISGVFIVLILFYLVTKLMTAVATKYTTKNND
jgi:Na+-transporting methylmalonyl-CoA/oxaloacetate decarboxylase gamma subunit